VSHLSVNLAIFGRNEKASERINHKSVDFIHTVLKVKGSFRSVHVPVVQYDGLENSSRLQLQLLTSFNQPFYEHPSHLDILGVDWDWNAVHALSICCAQNLGHRKAALETLFLTPQCFHASLRSLKSYLRGFEADLGEENATLSTISDTLVSYDAFMWTASIVTLAFALALIIFNLPTGFLAQRELLGMGVLLLLLLYGHITTSSWLDNMRVSRLLLHGLGRLMGETWVFERFFLGLTICFLA